ncbi:MAG: tyrosine-type recombinase/integrase, partial [Proteobacteria bacterium]|nr:tyrosine-type recombinase/integrase [Pseudomonadota bacterium]
IADKSLLAAFAKRDHRVTARHVDEAIKDSRRVIEQLPDINQGGWGKRILGALNRWAGDSRSAVRPPPAAAKPAPIEPRPDITVAEAADEWLGACQDRGLKPETLGERRRQVENIIKPTLGEQRAAGLTAEQIEGFIGQIAPGDARRVLASLNSILAEAARRRHIKVNPAKGVKAAHHRPAPKPPPSPTSDEIRGLLPAAGDELFVRMATALLTGLRVNELRALTWDNLDLENRMIHVRRCAVGGGELVRVRPKAARRSLPIAPRLAAILSEWREAGAELGLSLVFPGRDGGVMSAGLFQRGDFARLQKKLSLTGENGKAKYRFEDLRHAAARLLIEQGWPLRKLRDHLGEASIAATARRYGDSFARVADDRVALTLIADRLMGAAN